MSRFCVYGSCIIMSEQSFSEVEVVSRAKRQRLEGSFCKEVSCLAGESITMRDINESVTPWGSGNSPFTRHPETRGMGNHYDVLLGNRGAEPCKTDSSLDCINDEITERESREMQDFSHSTGRHKRKQESDDIYRVDSGVSANHSGQQAGRLEECEQVDGDISDRRVPKKPQVDVVQRPGQSPKKQGSCDLRMGMQNKFPEGLQEGDQVDKAMRSTGNSILQSQDVHCRVLAEDEVRTEAVAEVKKMDMGFRDLSGKILDVSCDGKFEDHKMAMLEEVCTREKMENMKLRVEVTALKRQLESLFEFAEQVNVKCDQCRLIKEELRGRLHCPGNKQGNDCEPSDCSGKTTRPSDQMFSAENTRGCESPVLATCTSEREVIDTGFGASRSDDNELDRGWIHLREEQCNGIEAKNNSNKETDENAQQGSAECCLCIDLGPGMDDQEIDQIKEVGTKLGSSLLIGEYILGRSASATELNNSYRNASISIDRDEVQAHRSPMLEGQTEIRKVCDNVQGGSKVRIFKLFGHDISEGCPLVPEANSNSEDLHAFVDRERIQSVPSTAVPNRNLENEDLKRFLEELDNVKVTAAYEGSAIKKEDGRDLGYSLKNHNIGIGVDKQGEANVPYIDLECGCTSQKHGDTSGILRLYQSGMLEVYCQCCGVCNKGKAMTPNQFEKHAGRAASKKWRESVWVVIGDKKVPFSRVKGLDDFCRRYKDIHKSKLPQPIKLVLHRDEFVRCKKCLKERRFKRRNKEECRLFHDALLNPEWECSNSPFDRLSCQDDEEREVRRANRGCSRSRTCQGCIECVCLGCFTCRFENCGCRTCSEFLANNV